MSRELPGFKLSNATASALPTSSPPSSGVGGLASPPRDLLATGTVAAATGKTVEQEFKELASPEPESTVVKTALTEPSGNASVTEENPAGVKERPASVKVLSPGRAVG